MDLNDIPGASAFAGGGVVVFDVLVQGGDLIAWFLIALLGSADLLVPILSTLDQLAAQTDAIPKSVTSNLLEIALVLLLISYGIRLVRRLLQDTNETN